MEPDRHERGETRKRLRSWKTLTVGITIAAVVLILLFKPLAISYHRWGLQLANKRIEQPPEGVDSSAAYNSAFFHCEGLERLGYAFHRNFVFDRVADTPEQQGVLFNRLNGFVKTLPHKPMLLECHSGPPGYDVMEFRVCDRVASEALWIKFHKQHNVPDLVERFGETEKP